MKKLRRSDDIINFNFYHDDKDEDYLTMRLICEKDQFSTIELFRPAYSKLIDYITQNISIDRNGIVHDSISHIHNKSNLYHTMTSYILSKYNINISKYDKLCVTKNEHYLMSKYIENENMSYDDGVNIYFDVKNRIL